MNKFILFCLIVSISLSGCLPGTRSTRTYQDRMTGNTIIESGDARLGTDIIGQNIYVGYIAHIEANGNIKAIIMEVTYNSSEWLFYDACWLKIDNNEIIKKTGLRPVREIIGTYNLMERGRFNIKRETLLAIINSNSGLIRTVGQKGYAEGEINQSLINKTKDFARKIDLIKK